MSDIHNLFHDAAPDEPTTEAWPEEVHARRHRNRVAGGVAAGTLAVALAVPLGIALLNQPNQIVASPAPTSTPTPQTVSVGDAESACAAAAEQVAGWAEADRGDLPAVRKGATVAWLCGDQMTLGPNEPLTTGLDDLVQAYLDQPEAPLDQACTMEYRMAYTLVFQYADGSLAPVTGELHGCRNLSDGATLRSGGEELLTQATEAWTTERATSDFHDDEPASCSEATMSILPFDSTQVSAVQTCTRVGESWDVDRVAVINDVDLATNADLANAVMESVTADVADAGDMWQPREPERRIEVIDRWGAKFVLSELQDGGFVFTDADGSPRLWTPTTELAALLAVAD